MSTKESKRRIPTSAELEGSGELPSEGRPGFLNRFFRVGRVRVSGDVAARKRMESLPKAAAPPGGLAPVQNQPRTVPRSPKVSDPEIQGAQPDQRTSRGRPVAARPVRMSAAVREQRGSGRVRRPNAK
jgi:hypothetical protein